MIRALLAMLHKRLKTIAHKLAFGFFVVVVKH